MYFLTAAKLIQQLRNCQTSKTVTWDPKEKIRTSPQDPSSTIGGASKGEQWQKQKSPIDYEESSERMDD